MTLPLSHLLVSSLCMRGSDMRGGIWRCFLEDAPVLHAATWSFGDAI